MRWIATMMLAMLLVGCEQSPPPPRDFSSSVDVVKTNGYVTKVSIYLPRDLGNGQTERQLIITVDNREELAKLIASLKSVTLDLEEAQKQMEVQE